MTAFAIKAFGEDSIPACILSPLCGAAAGYLARKYASSRFRGLRFESGGAFQLAAVVASFALATVFPFDADHHPDAGRAVCTGGSYLLAYYGFKWMKKTEINHSSALLNCALTFAMVEIICRLLKRCIQEKESKT